MLAREPDPLVYPELMNPAERTEWMRAIHRSSDPTAIPTDPIVDTELTRFHSEHNPIKQFEESMMLINQTHAVRRERIELQRVNMRTLEKSVWAMHPFSLQCEQAKVDL